MLESYIPVLITTLVALAIAVGLLGLSHLLGPRVFNRQKLNPYECGNKTEGITEGRVPIKFYLTAMLFLIFDVEIVFLYPWVLVLKPFKESGLGGLWLAEMTLFIVILLIGYVYMILRGALEWD